MWAIRYVADFSYEKQSGDHWELVVEDVKSKATRTVQYKIKRKLMLNKFHIQIQEI